MMIQQQIASLMQREGDYSNRSADRGGPTRWGITEAVARANGYKGDMKVLPQSFAAGIYLKLYWTAPHFDAVAAEAPQVAAKLFDIGVNCGTGTAGQMLQRALNVLTGSALKVDGMIVPEGATIKALRSYLAQRTGNDDEGVLVEVIACFQGERYAELVERDPTQRANIYGWFRSRVALGLDLVVPPHLAGA